VCVITRAASRISPALHPGYARRKTPTGKENDVQFLPCASFVALLSAGIIGVGDRAWAQSPEQFYAGKNIDFVIGYPPGGSNDTLGRLVARHIGKHIPGKPNVIAKNMPGAGSFLAVNTVFNVSPKDGSVIGIGAPTMPLDERLGTQGVRFKTAELNWIGRTDSLINMVFMWKTSPVQTIADALKTEATLSGTGVGSTVSIYPTALNNVIGTKFKLVMGYKGSNEAMLAVERGEVEGHSTSWTAVKVGHPEWWPKKTISILVQFSLSRHPELPDIPTAVDLARNQDEKQVLSAIMVAAEIGSAFFTTPGVPPERLAALRRAFDATMKDKEFLADALKTKLTVGPMSGEALQKLVTTVSNLSPEMLAKVRAAYVTNQHQ
jgi:tripartite-type tricarboxylate transporter receptor subunit TctC